MKSVLKNPVNLLVIMAIMVLANCADVPDEFYDEIYGDRFDYCILTGQQKECLSGNFTVSSCRSQGGRVSSNCPYSSSSSSQNGSNFEVCNGTEYDPQEQGCCGSVVYGLASQKCGEDNVVEGRCGNAWLNAATQYCSNGKIETYGYVTYGGKTYKTVKIGTQIWMAENLNYNAEGSLCYDNLESNCDKYGRLYNWAIAMDFEEKCNTELCISCPDWGCGGSQISKLNHKGICPVGWHLPTTGELYVLGNFVAGKDYFYGSGNYLKAKDGWTSCGPSYSKLYPCEDAYGFAALPGGYRVWSGATFFHEADTSGHWWTATELTDREWEAYAWQIRYRDENGGWGNNNKGNFFSVRCVFDQEIPLGSSSSGTWAGGSSSSDGSSSSGGTGGGGSSSGGGNESYQYYDVYSDELQRCKDGFMERKCINGEWYNYQTHYCHGTNNGGTYTYSVITWAEYYSVSGVYQSCGSNWYYPIYQICQDGVVEMNFDYYYELGYNRCGNTVYLPPSQRCIDENIETKCGEVGWPNNTTQGCYSELYSGITAVMDREKCGDGTYIVQKKCLSGNSYDPETQFCNGNDVLQKCGGSTYNPAIRKCEGDVIVNL
jgi:uncharacterized protein (TIGR02145 family)